jgi:tetratricopeptide (TPR) repeat protein/tRNA A-37 threonylcarbamoyl transferase component Bud32
MTTCPAENTLAELVRGGLAGGTAETVARHLDECSACAELVGVLGRILHDAETHLSTSPMEKGAVSFLPRGTRVGRFVVESLLGAGGMGVVYRAVDPELDRPVAVKLLKSELSGSEARARLLREGQAMARLNHPNVIVVYEVGRFRDQTFIAMELVKGQTLRDWLGADKRSWEAVLPIFVQAGRGLAAAHAAGIVHRDFKPANVLLSEDGRVRVMDFGLARAGSEPTPVDAASVSSSSLSSLSGELTESGALVGTPAYMAPEQRVGARADERSDQYSFCVSLYEGLHGARPGGMPRASDVPAWLRRALARGLARDPSARFPSMDALLAALAPASRRWWIGGAAAAVVLAAAATPTLVARPAACPGDGGLAGTWDDGRRAALHRAFVATGAPQSEAAFASAAAIFDSYAQAWTQRRTSVCSTLRPGASDPRLACLDDARRDLDATVAMGLRIDADHIGGAGLLGRPLPHLADCDRPSATLQPAASLQSAIDAARQKRTIAGVLRTLGRHGEALVMLRGLLDEARGLRYPPLESRVLEDLGTVQVELGDADSARQTFLAAIAAAEESNDDVTIGAVWTRLAYLVGIDDNNLPESHHFCRYAEAALTRAEKLRGPRPIERANLAQAEATLYLRELRYDEAGRLYRAAVEEADRIDEPSPGVAGVYQNYGVFLSEIKNFDEARRMYEKALAVLAASGSSASPDAAMVWNNISDIDMQAGDLDGALAAIEKSLALKEKILAPDVVPLAVAYYNLAEVLMRRGDQAHAAPYLERSIRIIRKRQGDQSPYLGYAYTLKGRQLLAEGKADDAVATLEQALAIREARPTAPQLLAETRLALADALWRARKDARARPLAVKAEQGFAEGEDADGRKQARAWLGDPSHR